MSDSTALKNLLNRNKTTRADGQAREKPKEEVKETEKEPSNELKEDERQGVKKFYLKRTGKGLQRYVRKQKHLPSTFLEPDYIKKARLYKDPLNEKQQQYKKDVLQMDDLLKPTPNVIKSNNRQGWHRYILWTELVACRNGFIYYTLPLIISIIFFLLNLTLHAFWVNAAFSMLILTDFLLIRHIIKNVTPDSSKFLMFILVAGLNVAAYFLAIQYPDWLAGLDLWFAARMLLIVFSIYHFGKFYINFAIMYSHDCNLDFGNTVQIKAGKPRSGKTSSAVQDAIILAKMKWQELQYDYWLVTSTEAKTLAAKEPEKLLNREEIILSYNFYIMRPCIPCLWSNIGVFDKKGRACHKVTLEHVKGLSRLPVYSVVLLDEIGAMLKADDGLNKSGVEKPLDISDMFRLGGHFLRWVVIGCEQDFNHIYIDCRRVVGFNQVIQGQEWICRPQLIYGIFKTLKFFISDGLDKTCKKSPKIATFMMKFEKFVKSIGFRKIKYGFATNTETNAGLAAVDADTQLVKIGKDKTRICPSNLAANYDDRAYKQKYASYFDKVIRGELHTHKCIDASDENTAAFVNTTVALSEKREAQKDKIREIA